MQVHKCGWSVTALLLHCIHLGRLGSKGKVFYGQEPPSREYTTTEYGANYQLLAVMLVVVDHSQLQTMASVASEMLDPINWPLPTILHRVEGHTQHLLEVILESWCSVSHV